MRGHDREHVYYGGYSLGHKVGDRALGLGFLRRDGFVSLDAGDEQGFLRTPRVTLGGAALTVNARVRGEMRVRVTDGPGRSLPGFGWDDGAPVRGDSLRHKLTWRKADASSLRDRPVRLEFRLSRAELFALAIHAV